MRIEEEMLRKEFESLGLDIGDMPMAEYCGVCAVVKEALTINVLSNSPIPNINFESLKPKPILSHKNIKEWLIGYLFTGDNLDKEYLQKIKKQSDDIYDFLNDNNLLK